MYRNINIIGICTLVFMLGCKEEMVGAPCVPETDNGAYSADISGTAWSIETGSVQCATNICLTQTRLNPASSDKNACKSAPSVETCWGVQPVELKFSFCSVRCRDQDGHEFNDNPDKYDYLAECPPSTHCEDIMDPIEGVSDKLPGGYCIPDCIKNPCSQEDGPKICTPSKNSEEPWKWYCGDIPGTSAN